MGGVGVHILDRLPLLRDANRSRIFNQIRATGAICRADLARQTGLHPSTISRAVSSLLDEGLVQERGQGFSDLGRKPIMLSVVKEAIHVVGIAVESTFISAVLVNLEAEVIDQLEIALCDQTMETALREICTAIDHLLMRAEERALGVYGIGLAMHGIVDDDEGICLFASARGAEEVAVAKVIRGLYQLPVRMDNNANAMALGERWFGKGKGVDNFLAIKVGQSIGSGVILRGQLFSGSHYSAGEIGHVNVVSDGPLCKCGNYGCLESVASLEPVISKGRLMLKRGENPELLGLTGNDPDSLSFDVLKLAAESGNELALHLWGEVGTYLGLALANAINLIDPTLVLIGGEILAVIDYVLPKMREIVMARSLKNLKNTIAIATVGLGRDSVAVGAATLVLRDLFEP